MENWAGFYLLGGWGGSSTQTQHLPPPQKKTFKNEKFYYRLDKQLHNETPTVRGLAADKNNK